MLVQLQGREVWYLQLNEAVSRRLVELMQERGMTQYQLYICLLYTSDAADELT